MNTKLKRSALPVFTIANCVLLIALCSGVACSTQLPPKGREAFYSYHHLEAIQTFRLLSEKQGKDFVFYNLAFLSSAMQAGDFWDAERAALRAMGVMWSDAGKERGTASLLSAEGIKIFKGEPFEKAVAAIYAGVIYFNRGDYDNSRAAFSKATLAIAQKQEGHQHDFALANFLLAKVLLKLGENDNAKIALERVKNVYPRHPYLDVKRLKDSNALFLIELGYAPQKRRTGPGASLIEWVRGDYPEREVSVEVSGTSLGIAAPTGDLYAQATTKGWTGKETVQAVKGATREAAVLTTIIAADQAAQGNKTAGWVALGAGVFALANQSQADLRQWEFLPGELHVLPAHLDPGFHTIHLRFSAEGKRTLPEYEQVWYHYPMTAGQERIFLFRSGPYKKNSKG